MNSRLTHDFIARFRELPDSIQLQARRVYQLWRYHPTHPSLHFKRVHQHEPLYSVRIEIGWRALGLLEGDTIYWFWIGSHSDYNHLLK